MTSLLKYLNPGLSDTASILEQAVDQGKSLGADPFTNIATMFGGANSPRTLVDPNKFKAYTADELLGEPSLLTGAYFRMITDQVWIQSALAKNLTLQITNTAGLKPDAIADRVAQLVMASRVGPYIQGTATKAIAYASTKGKQASLTILNAMGLTVAELSAIMPELKPVLATLYAGYRFIPLPNKVASSLPGCNVSGPQLYAYLQSKEATLSDLYKLRLTTETLRMTKPRPDSLKAIPAPWESNSTPANKNQPFWLRNPVAPKGPQGIKSFNTPGIKESLIGEALSPLGDINSAKETRAVMLASANPAAASSDFYYLAKMAKPTKAPFLLEPQSIPNLSPIRRIYLAFAQNASLPAQFTGALSWLFATAAKESGFQFLQAQKTPYNPNPTAWGLWQMQDGHRRKAKSQISEPNKKLAKKGVVAIQVINSEYNTASFLINDLFKRLLQNWTIPSSPSTTPIQPKTTAAENLNLHMIQDLGYTPSAVIAIWYIMAVGWATGHPVVFDDTANSNEFSQFDQFLFFKKEGDFRFTVAAAGYSYINRIPHNYLL